MHKLMFLILILLINPIKGFSCDCDGDYHFNSEFYHCDVVVLGVVEKVFDKAKESYKVGLRIIELYKGDSISKFIVYSIPENYEIIENGDTLIEISDCDIYLNVGEKWLIYADKNQNEEYGFGICSATKKIEDVDTKEFDFLNKHKNLIKTDNPKFYLSSELDNRKLISLSLRGYTLIIDDIAVRDLTKDKIDLNIKIDKNGFIVSDSINDENYRKTIKQIKEFEPFIPGTKNGEIVNSEYKMRVKKQ